MTGSGGSGECQGSGGGRWYKATGAAMWGGREKERINRVENIKVERVNHSFLT